MWEKFYERMQAKAASAGFIQSTMASMVKSVGSEMFHNRQVGGSGKIPKLWPFIAKYICDGLIKSKIGFGQCQGYTSGGAPLANKVRETFASLNMLITDGTPLFNPPFSLLNFLLPN